MIEENDNASCQPKRIEYFQRIQASGFSTHGHPVHFRENLIDPHIIMVSHDPLIASYSSRLLYLKDGKIEKELFKQYKKIGEEVDIMNKLKSAISNNDDIKEVDDDTLLSYYDLLTYLKFGITFKKVSYKKFNREVIYFYDDEGNYIIENQNDKDNVFDTYLSECEGDNTKFDRNIKILEK